MLVEKNIRVTFARVQIVEILGDQGAFGVVPGAGADAAARVGGFVAVVGVSLRAQVCVPGFVADTDRACQILANLIRAAEPAQVGGLAPCAGDKKLMLGLVG